MAFIILDATPATAVATNGTISFALPSGVAAGDLLDAGAKLWVEGHEALYAVGASNFSFTKASPIVLTYLGATSIPAGTRVSLQVELGVRTAAATAGAATLNQLKGKITSEALTTAAGAAYTLTLTNSEIAANDIVLVSVANGTNTQGVVVQGLVTPAAGSCVITVQNEHASQALNGTLVVSFSVIKAG
jgi:hypothetical protein